MALGLLLGGLGAARAEDAVDHSVFLIPRDQLATQEKQPFSLLWEHTEQQRRAAGEGHNIETIGYAESLERFSGASACLVEEEREKPVQNLLAFDWAAIGTWSDLEVCLGHVANSLKTPELIVRWMQQQGFDSVRVSEFVSPDGPWIYSIESFFLPGEDNNHSYVTGIIDSELYFRSSMASRWEYLLDFLVPSTILPLRVGVDVKIGGQTLVTYTEYNK